jgi:hypothetical protein
MKECRECGLLKPLSDFYKHDKMADGHLNKCKDCVKCRVKKYRDINVERIREYDRERGNRQPPEYGKQYRDRFPNKYKAHTMVNNAIRDWKLFSQPCELCGCLDSVGHHDDYLKPLKVRWLCQAHHAQWHVNHGEGLNAV